MLPAKYRLSKKRKISPALTKKKTVFGRILFLKCEKISEGKVEVGISAGTKFSRKSTERNLIKRRVREAVKSLIERVKPGYRIIFIAKANPEFSSNRQICFFVVRQEVESLLKKAGLIE